MPSTPIRHSRLTARAACVLLGCVPLGPVRPAAQAPVAISGPAHVDDSYQLNAPDDEAEGASGFTDRRRSPTADAAISDAFSARARLQASLDVHGVVSSRDFGARAREPLVSGFGLRYGARADTDGGVSFEDRDSDRDNAAPEGPVFDAVVAVPPTFGSVAPVRMTLACASRLAQAS